MWGFDIKEQHRATNIVEELPNYKHLFPLIDKQLLKQECHGMANRLGMRRPEMYDLGFPNNNCIGCPKAGMYTWNLVRKHFPEKFKLRSETERLIGYSSLRETIVDSKGKKITKSLFLDELDPKRGRREDEIMQDCNIFCQLNLMS